jgi:hypothetical protein
MAQLNKKSFLIALQSGITRLVSRSNTNHTDKVKEKLIQTIKTLYDRVQKTQEEKQEDL